MSTTLWNGSQQIMSEVSEDISTLREIVHPVTQLNVGQYSLTNLLSVNLNDPLDQRHEAIYFGTDDASTLVNSPVTTGQFYGYRTVAFMKRADDSLWLLKVTIHEILPNYGRCWTNVYSTGKSDWLGWKASGADSGVPFSGYFKKDTDAYSGVSIDVRTYSNLQINVINWSNSDRVEIYSLSSITEDAEYSNSPKGTKIYTVTSNNNNQIIDISSYNYVSIRVHSSSVASYNAYYGANIYLLFNLS